MKIRQVRPVVQPHSDKYIAAEALKTIAAPSPARALGMAAITGPGAQKFQHLPDKRHA